MSITESLFKIVSLILLAVAFASSSARAEVNESEKVYLKKAQSLSVTQSEAFIVDTEGALDLSEIAQDIKAADEADDINTNHFASFEVGRSTISNDTQLPKVAAKSAKSTGHKAR